MDKYSKKILFILFLIRLVLAFVSGAIISNAIKHSNVLFCSFGIFCFFISLFIIYIEQKLKSDALDDDLYLGTLKLMKEDKKDFSEEEYILLRKRLIKSKYQKFILKKLV